MVINRCARASCKACRASARSRAARSDAAVIKVRQRAMCAVLLRLPMTSVLLATVLLTSDGLAVMPVVIVAVVVAYLASAWLIPAPKPAPASPAGATPAGPAGAGSMPAAVSARQDRTDKPQDREDEADQA